MKSLMTSLLVVVAALLAAGVQVEAQEIYPLTLEEKAHFGATHKVVIDYEDFTTTATNTAETLTVSIGEKQAVSLTAMVLREAFDTGLEWTSSFAVIVGDGADDNHYLTTAELSAEGTEVWVQNGVAIRKEYTADDTLDFKFTPNAEDATSQNTVGRVEFYFSIIDAR